MSPLEHYRLAEELAAGMHDAWVTGDAEAVLALAAMARTEFEGAAAGAALVQLHQGQRVADVSRVEQRYEPNRAPTAAVTEEGS
jgi:predicted hydrolase (HD superfamily)